MPENPPENRPGNNAPQTPGIKIFTPFGEIEVELYCRRAPLSTANILNYVDLGLYDGSTFFRVLNDDNQPGAEIKIAVIQGGPKNDNPCLLPPVPHEPTSLSGLTHKDGTISLARWEGAGSAQASFFICVGDQPALDFGGKRNPDGQGFAAFGQVTSGMDVVQRIWAKAEKGEYLTSEIPILKVERLS